MTSLKSYELGLLSEKEIIQLFQDLINSGDIWDMPRHYQNKAYKLIEEGYCKDA